MDTKNYIKRFSVLAAFVTFLALMMSVFAFYQTGIIRGINPEADETRDELTKTKFLETSVEGTFFDRNNIQLTQSNGKGVPSTILYTNELSCIIGTRSGSGALSGLRSKLQQELFDMDEDYDGIGAQVNLTLDIGLQKLAYSILKENRMAGSINVIDADTGEILCMASRGNENIDFDANSFSENFDKYNRNEGSMTNTAIAASTSVGSTFKIITGIGILENDIEESYTVENPFVTPAGSKIYNNEGCPMKPGSICYFKDGFRDSVNTYFATRGLLIGAAKYMDLLDRFFIGKSIELDFATLKSHCSIQGRDPSFELASTAYGQGKTLLSPLQLCSIMASIISDGRDMAKPYLIKEITNEGKTVLKGKTEYLRKNVIGPIVAKQLKEALHYTATGANAPHYASDAENARCYGFEKEKKGTYGYVIAKTGTCETGEKTKNHIFILLGYSFNGRNYAICIDRLNVPRDVYGGTLRTHAKTIIDYLNTVTV